MANPKQSRTNPESALAINIITERHSPLYQRGARGDLYFFQQRKSPSIPLSKRGKWTAFANGRFERNSSARFILLVALSLTSHAQAEVLGRLFFTPEERTQLEQQQAQQALKARLAETSDGGNSQSVITVNGLIKRSDGSRIVWINGKAQKLGPSSMPNVVPITVPGKDKPVDVKVGQRVVVDNPVSRED